MSSTPHSSLNQKLRKKREAYQWTIEEVSAKIGVDVRTYRRWERGTQRPHSHSLKRLCTLFESSAEDLGYDFQV